MGIVYTECQYVHSNIGDKHQLLDGCEEFTPSSTLYCNTCRCLQMYHRKVEYSKCLKVHDLKNPNSVDGCQDFCPSPKNVKCAVCGRHRNFHQKEVITNEVVPTASGGAGAVPSGVKKERLS